MTLTLTPLTGADAQRFDGAQFDDGTAYRVADTRVSGVVAARRILSGNGSPTHRPIDPTTDAAREDTPTALYPALWLTFGAQARGTYLNTHDTVEMYPEPFNVNGRDYHRVTVHVDFYPVGVAGLDVDYRSPQSVSPWNRYPVETARKRARDLADGVGGVLFVESVPGTNGERSHGVFIADVSQYDRGEMTEAGRRTAERIAVEILRAQIDAGVETDWLDDVANHINGQIAAADEIAHRWNVESARLQNLRVAARTAAVAGHSVRVAR
ncbi:hypothetical protein SEA_NOSILAM_79 [Gordonia phage NosilaM]|uniref:Uncharacterized protein n=1 Tax=Gordonia phage NosilaM TaxID=2507863 RepID=A0A410TE86_9CAUD|nr:hypothetical protein KNU46_gp79 [Gordonia phage NosilaM]QAU07320.1 hypothetical protein SEA_NOSILAM_79 [Gordonia phage NosilaM]